MEYKLAIIATTSVGIEHVSNLLITIGIGGFEVCDSSDFKEFLSSRTPAYDYVDDAVMELANARSCIKFYTADNEQGDDIINKVDKALTDMKSQDTDNIFGTLELNVSIVDDSDWKDNWKQFYKPMEIGDRLVVTPAWEHVDSNKLVLKIDPGMAFGTGSHETTSLCLEYLQELELSDKSVLDVGCGSGILSQGAVLLGAKNSVGCDIDEAAVTAADNNAALNGLTDKVKYFKGDLLDNVSGKFEVVVANIVADIVMLLTDDIGKVICDDGIFISSGIIVERVPEVKSHIEQRGFEILEIKQKRGWAAIKARRKL